MESRHHEPALVSAVRARAALRNAPPTLRELLRLESRHHDPELISAVRARAELRNALPTLILFKDGEPQLRLIGAKPKGQLIEEISAYL